MDNIFVTGLRIPTTIGVHDWEKKIKQTLVIDVSLATDSRKAGQSDALADALDYWQLCQSIKNLLADNQFQLIEAVAEKIAASVLAEFNTSEVTVQVTKPSVASDLAHVGVKITRAANV